MNHKKVTIEELEKFYGFEFYDEFTEEEKENTIVTLFEDGSVENEEGHQIAEPSEYVDFSIKEKKKQYRMHTLFIERYMEDPYSFDFYTPTKNEVSFETAVELAKNYCMAKNVTMVGWGASLPKEFLSKMEENGYLEFFIFIKKTFITGELESINLF